MPPYNGQLPDRWGDWDLKGLNTQDKSRHSTFSVLVPKHSTSLVAAKWEQGWRVSRLSREQIWKKKAKKRRRLRFKGREAKASGLDPTDYSLSPTARSFVPFYTQRLSADCVLNGAKAIQKSLKRATVRRRSAVAAE